MYFGGDCKTIFGKKSNVFRGAKCPILRSFRMACLQCSQWAIPALFGAVIRREIWFGSGLGQGGDVHGAVGFPWLPVASGEMCYTPALSNCV